MGNKKLDFMVDTKSSGQLPTNVINMTSSLSMDQGLNLESNEEMKNCNIQSVCRMKPRYKYERH